jgi:exodeoxyribonuclease V gamma subunit
LDEKGFESIRRYVQGDETGIKLYQLSRHLSETFDQYIIFRDEAILQWQEGRFYFSEKDRDLEYWQSVLWRELAEGNHRQHRASLKTAFLEALGPEVIDVLPERISIFGISYLPLFHLEIFHALSSYIPVNLFLMNPCSQYWGDIRCDSEMSRIFMKTPGLDREDLHFDEGNSLLASLGGLGKQLFDVLQEFDLEENDFFEDVDTKSLLGTLQSDILNLRNRSPENKQVIDPLDNSIQVHLCHSPMREVEVLYDNLLSLFDNNTGLKPEDIVIMAPDIEAYAPFIQAVFDIPKNNPKYIPFSIADQTLRTQSEIADTFLSILDLAGARFEVSKVLALLESNPLQKKFAITDDNLELIQRWVQETRICWGRDGENKQELGLPGYKENTWQFGLERLLLGYAMHSAGEKDFAGILPYDDMEGDDAAVLGCFHCFVSTLFDQIRTLNQSRTLVEWSLVLVHLLEEFFYIDEEKESQFRSVHNILTRLADIQGKTGYGKVVSLDVVRAYTKQCLEVKGEGTGFLSSGVTFCAMLLMRSIPFKVVCLLGMNHDAYPRQTMPKGFDLIARNPRAADRNRRSDDLYLFLEAMLSARQILYMSCVGQSIEDNTPIPPSVLISSLLDYLEQGFTTEDSTGVRSHIITRHALQAFNPHYFYGSPSLFSYSQENAQAAISLGRKDKPERVFWTGQLSEPGDEWKVLDINALCDFFVNPARFLLQNRLGMIVSEGSFTINDREPFDLDALELYLLSQQHIQNTLKGMDRRQSFQLFRMSGQLPHGQPGESLFNRMDRVTDALIRVIQRSCEGQEPEDVLVDVPIGDFLITGTIPTLEGNRLVRFRHADLKGTDIIRTWILHLVLCAVHGSPDNLSCCIARDRMATFEYAESCRDILASLLDQYWQGLMRPLHFFPQASWKYADPGRNRDKSPKDPIREARLVWNGNFNPGECLNTYYQICFLGVDPLDQEFEDISKGVYVPLLKHLRIEDI